MDKKRKNINTNKYIAVSLLETLVYIAIFSILFISVVQYLFIVSESSDTTQKRLELARFKLYAYQHLETSFEQAESIDTDLSTFEDNSGVLYLVDETGGTFTLEYSTNAGILEFSRDGGSAVELSSNNIVIDRLYFDEVYGLDSTLNGVQVDMDFHYKDKANITESITHIYNL
jgi:type II secretory pathway component PulJ